MPKTRCKAMQEHDFDERRTRTRSHARPSFAELCQAKASGVWFHLKQDAWPNLPIRAPPYGRDAVPKAWDAAPRLFLSLNP